MAVGRGMVARQRCHAAIPVVQCCCIVVVVDMRCWIFTLWATGAVPYLCVFLRLQGLQGVSPFPAPPAPNLIGTHVYPNLEGSSVFPNLEGSAPASAPPVQVGRWQGVVWFRPGPRVAAGRMVVRVGAGVAAMLHGGQKARRCACSPDLCMLDPAWLTDCLP